MVIQINNKEYEMVFNYMFVKYVMRKHKWTKFSEYDAFLQKFSFDEDSFGPEHLEKFGELVVLGISANKGKSVAIAVDDVVNAFWSNMDLLKEVTAYFVECQPKSKEVVDPVARGN